MKKYNLVIDKNYSEIDPSIKGEKLPLVCLSGVTSNSPKDFNYVVFDSKNNIRAKFIEIEYAKEYAEFLSCK